jgi:hypothetical protein
MIPAVMIPRGLTSESYRSGARPNLIPKSVLIAGGPIQVGRMHAPQLTAKFLTRHSDGDKGPGAYASTPALVYVSPRVNGKGTLERRPRQLSKRAYPNGLHLGNPRRGVEALVLLSQKVTGCAWDEIAAAGLW